MLVSTLIAFCLTFAASVQASAAARRYVDVYYWPLSVKEPQLLCKISYNAEEGRVVQYARPVIPPKEKVIRLGFYKSGSWNGIATAATTFAAGQDRLFQLYVDDALDVVHLGFKGIKKNIKTRDLVEVEMIPIQKGPVPQVNKPVVLNAEGQVEQKEPEKSFIQKYWWVLAGFLVVQVLFAGGKE